MRSKNKNRNRNKKQKAAYRRSDNVAAFLKRGTFVLLIAVLIAAVVLGVKMLEKKFSVQTIMISGNYHIDRDDIIKELKINKGESLVGLHFDDVGNNLKKNPWIKKVAIRKQYPDTLVIKIDEASPKALLRVKKRFYLLDRDGDVLERIEGETIPFLPVIKNISRKNKKGMTEALKLVEVLSGKSGFVEWESIEIGIESYGLTAEIDGEFIKVGYGKYSQKFDRWIELEPEIRKRGVPVKYVDLRFKDSVIVKPMKEKKGEKSS